MLFTENLTVNGGPPEDRTRDQPLKRKFTRADYRAKPACATSRVPYGLLGCLAIIVSFACTASAQTPKAVPDPVDCSLLTPEQSKGLVCLPKPKPTSQVLTSTPTLPPNCENVNAYERPEEARACVISTITETSSELPVFVVGRKYTHVYGDRTIIVLSVGMSLEGHPVATVQYTAGQPQGEASVFAFIVTAESGVWR